MDAWTFALFVFFASNPLDDGRPYAVPIPMALAAFHQAALYDDITPEEAIGMMVGEHGKRLDDEIAFSKGDKGRSLGLYQLQRHEWKEYNEAHGTQYNAESMMDWEINTIVAVYALHDHKRTHATKRRCTKKVNGEPQKHTWHAHHLCSPAARERCQDGYQVQRRLRLIDLFSAWRKYRMFGDWGPVTSGMDVEPAEG